MSNVPLWESCASLTVACTLLPCVPGDVNRSTCLCWAKVSRWSDLRREKRQKMRSHDLFKLVQKVPAVRLCCVSPASFWDVVISNTDSGDRASDSKFKSAACVVSTSSLTSTASMMRSDDRDCGDSADNILKARPIVEPEVASSGCCSEVWMLKEPLLTPSWLYKNRSVTKKSGIRNFQIRKTKREISQRPAETEAYIQTLQTCLKGKVHNLASM